MEFNNLSRRCSEYDTDEEPEYSRHLKMKASCCCLFDELLSSIIFSFPLLTLRFEFGAAAAYFICDLAPRFVD